MGSSGNTLRYICVFCGATKGTDEAYVQAARHLGTLLAGRGIGLVYGGGSIGLMGCVAEAAAARGGQVLGVVPTPLKPYIGPTAGEELEVLNLSERLDRMISSSDACIALPGGLATLEDIFHLATRIQLNVVQKPLGLLNIAHYYDGLLFFLDHAVRKGFISPETRQIVVSATTAERLLEKLNAFSFEPHPVVAKLDWWTDMSRKRKRNPSY